MRDFKRALIVSLLIFSGCASYGPMNSPEFSVLVNGVLPSGAGEAVFARPGSWYPNTQGFSDIRSSFLSRPVSPIPGIVVIAADGLYFEQWNKKKKAYEIMLHIGFDEMKSSAIDTFGLNRRFSVQKSDYTFHSFDITKAKGQMIDRDGTEEAYALVAEQTKKNP